MPHFLFKKPQKFSINFSEIENEAQNETPFWEIQRAEVIEIITTFYSNWQALWQGTKQALGNLNLSDESLRRLHYYENEQQQTVLNLLADTLVAWEKDDGAGFSAAVFDLARELRPSLMHFETDATDTLTNSKSSNNPPSASPPTSNPPSKNSNASHGTNSNLATKFSHIAALSPSSKKDSTSPTSTSSTWPPSRNSKTASSLNSSKNPPTSVYKIAFYLSYFLL